MDRMAETAMIRRYGLFSVPAPSFRFTTDGGVFFVGIVENGKSTAAKQAKLVCVFVGLKSLHPWRWPESGETLAIDTASCGVK